MIVLKLKLGSNLGPIPHFLKENISTQRKSYNHAFRLLFLAFSKRKMRMKRRSIMIIWRCVRPCVDFRHVLALEKHSALIIRGLRERNREKNDIWEMGEKNGC